MDAIFFNEIKKNHISTILDELYDKEIYRPYLQGRKDLNIIDAGANIGLTSYYFSQFANNIQAYEPDSTNFACLAKNIEHNKLSNIVYPIKRAIAGKNGTAKFYHSTNYAAHSLNDVYGNSADYEEAETVTIEQAIQNAGFDKVHLLKLDIEGQEFEVLNSDAFDRVKNNIEMIIGEYHDWTNTNPTQLRLMLKDKGYMFNWVKCTSSRMFIAQR